MTEDEFKPIVRAILGQFGFQCRDLEPRHGLLTPDFEVYGKKDKYTIELKIKDDDAAEIAKEAEALAGGGVVGKSTPIGPRNRLAGIIGSGVEQLLAHDPKGESFRVLWLHSAGQDPELHDDRFYATLFGTEKLFSLKHPRIVTCFYYHASAFYSWREHLDGALLTYLISDGLRIKLCINTLSPKIDQFRQCELVQIMSQATPNALCDPDKWHGLENDVMIADCPNDRKQSGQLLAYLKQKYGLEHLQDIPMQKHTGKILMKQSEDA
jgi:hypothetical protein